MIEKTIPQAHLKMKNTKLSQQAKVAYLQPSKKRITMYQVQLQ